MTWQDSSNTHPPTPPSLQPWSTRTQVKTLEGALWHLVENMWLGLRGWVGDWLVPVFTSTPRFNFSPICTLSGQAAFFATPWSFAFRGRRRRDFLGQLQCVVLDWSKRGSTWFSPLSIPQTFQRVEQWNRGARQQAAVGPGQRSSGVAATGGGGGAGQRSSLVAGCCTGGGGVAAGRSGSVAGCTGGGGGSPPATGRHSLRPNLHKQRGLQCSCECDIPPKKTLSRCRDVLEHQFQSDWGQVQMRGGWHKQWWWQSKCRCTTCDQLVQAVTVHPPAHAPATVQLTD